jgi:hypothetical protein
LLLLGLMVAAPAAAQKRVNPSNWFDALDLSRRLVAQAGSGGKVVMAIDVSSDGRPDHCAIAVSSGIADLDTLSCDLVMRRARWLPRRDAAGQAIPGVDRVPVDWRLFAKPSPPTLAFSRRGSDFVFSPGTYLRMKLPQEGSLAMEVALTSDGKVTRCAARPGGSSGSVTFDGWFCRRLIGMKPFIADADGRDAAFPPGAVVNTHWTVRSSTSASLTGSVNSLP